MGRGSNKNIVGVISAVGSLVVAATPLVEKAIDNAKNDSSEKSETSKVVIPELYRKGFPIDLEQAETMLSELGLKVSKSKLRVAEADPKYKNCEDTQILDSSPRQGTKVKQGTTVCLRYITQDVIDASQKIFDNNIQAKQEAKEKKVSEKLERNEKMKGTISETMGAAKNNIGKIFKKEHKAAGITDEKQ